MSLDKKEVQEKMLSSINALKKLFDGVRTGRALPAFLDPVMVDAYGGRSPLSSMANVTSVDARVLSVQVWDVQLVSAVSKAIRAMGFQTQEDGGRLRVFFPEMSQEQREKMVKMARDYAEKSRVSLRATRRHFMDLLDKEKSMISEDSYHAQKKELQGVLDDHIATVNTMEQNKEKEIMDC